MYEFNNAIFNKGRSWKKIVKKSLKKTDFVIFHIMDFPNQSLEWEIKETLKNIDANRIIWVCPFYFCWNLRRYLEASFNLGITSKQLYRYFPFSTFSSEKPLKIILFYILCVRLDYLGLATFLLKAISRKKIEKTI
jgi:hypothetical protein